MDATPPPIDERFCEATRARAIALMEGRFGREALMPLAALTLPVMSSRGVVVYRVERWNKSTGHYVAWRPLDDGTPRIHEFPPGCHDLLRADFAPIAPRDPVPGAFLDRVAEVITTPGQADETFLKALGFDVEELPNVERLAPYLEEEARRAAGRKV